MTFVRRFASIEAKNSDTRDALRSYSASKRRRLGVTGLGGAGLIRRTRRGDVFLGFHCPVRSRRVQSAPCAGVAPRSAPPTLDPPPTHTESAPIRIDQDMSDEDLTKFEFPARSDSGILH